MHPHAVLITKFYEAFARLDAETMAACYHPEVHFSDPAFPSLRGVHAGNMWRMLCEQATHFELTFSDVSADDQGGRAHWEPVYDFGPSKRRVHNIIDAEFSFRDGLIVRHVDTFDVWRWSKQALGTPGLLLGWSGFFGGLVQKKAGGQLSRWESKNAG